MTTEELNKNLSIINGQRLIARPESVRDNSIRDNLFIDNRFFVGRDTELSELKEWFSSNKVHRVAVLYGMGGIGKTELATQFIKQTDFLCPQKVTFDDGQAVNLENFLLRIDYNSEIITKYANLVNQNKDMANKLLRDCVRELSPDVILFIDNANELNEKFIRDLVFYSQCRFLITTRKKLDLPDNILNKNVTELSCPLTSEIFKHYYGEFKTYDRAVFENSIYNEFKGNTQAIIWVAKMLKEQNISLEEYKDKHDLYLKNNSFNGDIHGNDRFDTVANNLCEFLRITDITDFICDNNVKRILAVLTIIKQFGISEKYLKKSLGLNTSNEIIKLNNFGIINRENDIDDDCILTMHPMVERALSLYGIEIALCDCKIVIDYVQDLFNGDKIPADLDHINSLNSVYMSMQSFHESISEQIKSLEESKESEIKTINGNSVNVSLDKKNYDEDDDLDILDILLDEENREPIVLLTGDGKKIIFEQVAVIPFNDKIYCLLRPVDKIEGIEEDQAVVFYVDEDFGVDPVLMVETDEKITMSVFLRYQNLLIEDFKNLIG